MYTQGEVKLPSLTTYQADFKIGLDNLPPLPFCQEPCLYQLEGKLDPRCFPISLPTFPHRKRESAFPIAAGFETSTQTRLSEAQNQKKNKRSKSRRSSSRSSSKTTPELPDDKGYHHSVPSIVLQELAHLHTYTPSSDLREIHSPTEDKERELLKQRGAPCISNTSVRYRQSVKNTKPENWQKVGCIWDKVQERNGFNSTKDIRENITNIESTRLLSRPRMEQTSKSILKEQSKSQPAKKEFNRNIPGYGGYEPQLPIQRNVNNHGTRTTMNSYFRQHPRVTYRLPEYGHKGPMSRLVTLTEPLNPFNKIINQRISVS